MKQLLTLMLVVSLSACGTAQKVRYSALETMGVHKRDILVDRIEKTTATQEAAKTQFQTAYQELASLIEVDDQGLEQKYKKMSKAVSRSESRANELDDRIKAVNSVAVALFKEWEQEITEYQSDNLRQASAKNLASTRERYGVIYQKMQESQERVKPVLQVLQDNTLFLKHNLNARAVSSLSGEAVFIENKIKDLVQQMETSIEESKAFVGAMKNS